MTNTTTKIQILRDALTDEHAWLEAQRKAISKGCGSSWDMGQRDERMDLIDAALRLTEGSPDTHVLVPRKATHSMAWAIALAFRWKGDALHIAENAWRDAVNAAPSNARPAPTPTAEAPGEPFYWLEADASARGADPRDVFGKDSMYSTRLSKNKPSGSNPFVALFLHPALKASAELAPDCTRSHPHEDMDAACEAETVQARADFKRSAAEQVKRAAGGILSGAFGAQPASAMGILQDEQSTFDQWNTLPGMSDADYYARHGTYRPQKAGKDAAKRVEGERDRFDKWFLAEYESDRLAGVDEDPAWAGWQARGQQQAGVPDGWQPIATAPKDGYMLVHEDGALRALLRINGAWHKMAYPAIIAHPFGDAIVGDDAKRLLPTGYRLELRDGCCENPTDWMPLPAAPTLGGAKS